MEEKIAQFQKILGITREQAIQLIEDDEKTDKGADLYPLTEEQKKVVKQAKNTGTRKATSTKRERKEDTDKQHLVNKLVNALADTEDLTIKNKEREIEFRYNGRKFKIVLSAPRS